MGLDRQQKKYLREHIGKQSVAAMAKMLGVPPREVRQGIRELGLSDPELERKLAKDRVSKAGDSGRRSALRGVWARMTIMVKRYPVGLGLVLGLAGLLRLIHLLQVKDSPFFLHLHTDPFMYHHWAVQISQGDWLGASQPVFYLGPLYPYFLAVVYTVFGPSTLAAVGVQVLLSIASVGLIYHLGWRLFGPATALLAGLLSACYGMFIFFSCLILGETLIVFLNLVMLVFLVSGIQRPAWHKWLLAGLFLGLSATARGSILIFAPLAGLAIVVSLGWKAWKQWLPAGLLLTLGTLLVLSPVSLHNRLVGDDWVLLTANVGANLFIGNNAQADGIYMRNARYKGRPMGLSVRDQQANFPEVARKELGQKELKPSAVSAFWVAKTGEEIASDFGGWLKLLGNKLKYFFNAYEVPNNRNFTFSRRFSSLLRLPLVTFGSLVGLGIAGLLLSLRTFRKRGVLAMYFVACLLALTAFFVNGRYRLAVVPVMLLFAAAMVRWIYLQASRRKWLKLSGALVLVGLVTWIAYLDVPRINYRANFLNLANAYRDLEQPEKALENYDKALEISPDFYYALFKKGEVLNRLGRIKEAREQLTRALRLASRNNDRLNAGRIRTLLKRVGKSE